jgi:hypothetical protein
MPIFNRAWAMPSPDTFTIPPIRSLLERHCRGLVVDPFARNSRITEYSNDINPATDAQYHLDAVEFLDLMLTDQMRFDVALLDPPYSARQVMQCYQSVGREVTQYDTQFSPMYNLVRDRIDTLLVDGGVTISCGWNSIGMGTNRRFRIIEILLVSHGSWHNDTIVTVERKRGLNLPGHSKE